MNINNYECEGYGFRILNCEPFTLMPNATKKIDITFIPDFTTSRVTRNLRLMTAMGQVLDFTLLATLPHHLLPLCASALPRPYWEPYLHIVTAIVMSTIFIFIIFFAYFDAQKYVVQCTFTAGGLPNRTHGKKDMDIYTAGTVFDLNAIAAGVKVSRISDKKEKLVNDIKVNNNDSNLTYRSSATHKPHQPLVKSNSNPKQSNISSKERKNSVSDCSTSSVSSRKNSDTNSLHDEKPESKKEPNTPPKRNKRKQEHHRSNGRMHVYQEPLEPKIVTEEISDPWEKRKLKQEIDEEKQRNKKRARGTTRKEQPSNLHKESSTSSSIDDEHQDIIPGFTPVEKNKLKKRSDYSGHGTMDKLDEISLNGPRPEVKEHRRTRQEYTKNNKVNHPPRTRKPVHHYEKERVSMDTPAPPHEIAEAIIEAALVKSQQKKKSAGNSPSHSNKTSPKHSTYEEPETKSRKPKKESSSGGITSYLRKMIGGAREHSDPDSPTQQNNGNSMFYYDNLSSLRASKKPSYARPRELERTTSSPSSSGFSSTLSPEVPEFVPAAQRINKAPGSNVKKDTSWATVDDSALEYLRPPPGLTKLTKPSAKSIWGLDSTTTRTSSADTWSKPSLFSDFKTDSYSSLLGSQRQSKTTSTTFSGLDLLTSRDERDGGSSSIWKSDSIDKDLFGSSNSLGRSSIWDAPDIPPPSGSLSARSRLGLGLDLNPVSEAGATESPLDPFSIWASSDSVSPYAGWNKDIKED